jgi:hypothetical protein
MRRSTSRMEGVRLAGKAAEESDMITTNKKHRLALCVATPKSAGKCRQLFGIDTVADAFHEPAHAGAAGRQPIPAA